MKDAMKMFVFMALLSAAVGVGASDDAGVQHEADHAALRALMTNVVEAINSQDLDKLSTCFTEDFIFTAVDQTVLTSTAEIKEYYSKMVDEEKSPVRSFAINPKADMLTRFIDENTGYCYGRSEDEYILRRNDRMVTMTSRWTAVVVKKEGQWKIAAAHSGVNFLDNPVLKARGMTLWRKMLLAAGIGKYPGEK